MNRAVLFPQPGDAFHQILNGLARKLPHGDDAFLRTEQTVLVVA
jgi:putative beta-1,4-xylosyltransferase IRX10